ncbi:MAG: polyprenol monophosphomannose synthase [Lachnospiraceae bacterium]|nr:polyprenol monophosphomannose synthase [Lachnospiraceae bacterium]
MKTLTIIVPTYNEADNIFKLCNELEKYLADIPYHILFVDDSVDNTPDIIKSLMEVNSKVQLHHRENEKGLATAVLKGFELAQGDYIAVMDADLQHPPHILRDMYVAIAIGEADICIPSRFIPGGNDGGLNLYRSIVSGTARYIGKIILPCLRRLSDPTSGLFMFKRTILQDANEMKPIGWKIMIEVLATCTFDKIIEIPYSFQNRTAGESKLSSKVTMQYIKQIFDLKKRGKSQKHILVERWSLPELAAQKEIFKNTIHSS